MKVPCVIVALTALVASTGCEEAKRSTPEKGVTYATVKRQLHLREGSVGHEEEWFVGGTVHVHADELDETDRLTAQAGNADGRLDVTIAASHHLSGVDLVLSFARDGERLSDLQATYASWGDIGAGEDPPRQHPIDGGWLTYEWQNVDGAVQLALRFDLSTIINGWHNSAEGKATVVAR